MSSERVTMNDDRGCAAGQRILLGQNPLSLSRKLYLDIEEMSRLVSINKELKD